MNIKKLKFALAGALTLTATSATMAQANTQITCGSAYTISAGDTLSKINKAAYGNYKFLGLYEANKNVIGADPSAIEVGQVLQIPCLSADGNQIAVSGTATASSYKEVRDADGNLLLTFNKVSAPPFVMNKGIIDLYLNEITEVTEGRVQFVSPDVMSRDRSEQFDLVTSGAVDGTYVLNSTLKESHPLLQIPMIPLFGGSAEQTAVSLWRLHDEYLSKTDYFDQAQLMGFVGAPAAHIWRRSDDPITPGEDILAQNVYPVPYFEGIDTRGPPAVRKEVTKLLSDYDAANGDNPTTLLAHGAARAVGIWPGEEPVTVTEVDYGLYTPTFSVILSNEAWAKISAADQSAILAISGEKLASRSASWDAFDNGFRSDMLANNLDFVKADEALLSDISLASLPLLNAWIAEADARDISGSDAVRFYANSLRSLEDRLIYRDKKAN